MKKERNTSLIPDELVMSKIYLIREQKVMLDSDLAELYGVETKVLNQAINRNMERFPEDFMFQLDQQEWSNLKSQIVTSSWGGRRKVPRAFTEYGVLMLSSVLNSARAIQVNIQVMRVFSRFRKYLSDHDELRVQIEEIRQQLHNNSKNIELVFQYLDELVEKKTEPKPRKRIGFKSDDL
ncbi:ORF6N domain-containing protein [Daejeonella sp.]|uniref:ORF6N domain-containing protein n=1 Tax=Daejeonella sp. TaxID=2805397 RepID=UPI0030C08391